MSLWWNHSNSSIRITRAMSKNWFLLTYFKTLCALRREFIQIAALSALDGSVVDYRGYNG